MMRCVDRCVFLILICIFVPQMASADEEDALNFVAGAGVRYEDNLFRLSDSANTSSLPGKPDKSDWVYSENVGIKIDKPYAQQRFQFDFTVSNNKFQNNGFLNYIGVDYRGAWLWHLTPHLSGTLLVDQEQRLINFADFRSFNDRNVTTNQVHVFNLDGEIGSGLHLIGGLLDVRSRNSQDFTAVGNYRQQGGEAGIKYITSSETWFSLLQRETNGEYQGRSLDPSIQLDTGFKESETEARLNWKATERSTVDIKLGYLNRSHDHFSQRDYSGMVGKIEYDWLPLSKLKLTTSLGRSLYSFQEATNSYYVADTFKLSSLWELTSKTTLSAYFENSRRDYHGAIVPIPALRKDSARAFGVDGKWQALKSVSISGNFLHQTRTSNFDNLDYTDNVIGISTLLIF